MKDNTESPLVSIICPAYNAEGTIKDTLKTILNQTYRNIEIIIVDDGSTDGTVAVCEDLAKEDLRIKLYHIENHGVAYARNFALQHAKGYYICFVDADDLLKPVAVEKMLFAAINYGKMLVICKYWHGAKHSSVEFFNYETKDNPVVEEIDFNKFRFTNKYTHSVVWGALYHRDLLSELKFRPDLFIGEDTYYFAEALYKAREIAFVDDVYYYYMVIDSSLAHRKYEHKHMTEINAWEDVCNLFSSETLDFYNECRAQLCWTCIKNYERAIESNYNIKEDLDLMYFKAKENNKYLMASKELPISKKIYALFFLCFPNLMSSLNLRRFSK